MMRWFPLVFCGLAFISCQSVEIPKITQKRFKCDQLDWFEIGRNDGVLGKETLDEVEESSDCDGFTANQKEMYTNGWYSGLDEFCTKGQGFAFGRSGGEYKKICPPSKELSFLKGYKKGQKVFLYEKDNKVLREQLDEVTRSSTQDNERLNKGALQKKAVELETRLELNRALISEIQKELDESDSQRQTF